MHPPPLSRSPKPPANPANSSNHIYNMTRVVIYRNSSHVKTEMSSSDTPLAARCMKPSQTPASQEDTIGLSSFITHACSQRSFIFNRERSRQEEMGSSALFPVIYKGRQPGLHRKQPGTDSGSSELLYGHTSPSTGQKPLQNCPWSKAHALFFAKPAKSCFSDFNNLSAAVARAEKGQEQQTRTPHNSTPLGRCVSPCAISGAHECSPWGLKQSTGSSRSGSL